MALALSPATGAACLPDEPCPLVAGFGPGSEVEDLQGMVYVWDETQDGKLVYSAPMTCAGRECADPAQAFEREDGHTYTVRFLLQGRSNDVLFGDWAESTLAMEPAVYLRGLPPSLDLKTQPAGGWPITVVAGTTEDLGQLRASIALTRTNDSTPVPDVQVDFAAEVSGAGEQQALLKVTPPSELRPGSYEGLISFATDGPSTGRDVRLPSPIPVSLNLSRPAVEIADAAVDFGTVLFDTSPNFRVSETAYVPLAFDESPFNLTPEPLSSSCPGLELVAGPPEMQGQAYRMPLILRSSGPIAPQTCSGTFALRGPSEDYEVDPEMPLSWRLVIPAVEWEILGVQQNGASAPDAYMGSLGQAGERKGATLHVRYTGAPPFSLQLADLNASTEHPGVTAGKDDLDLVTASPVAKAGAADEYEVPIELLVRRSLPQASPLAHWLSGTDYGGKLKIRVAGLPASQSQEVSFRLHNPGLYQRYVQPFYHLLLPGVVTIPLSIVIPLLVLVLVWKRRKDASVERLMRQARPRTPAAEAGSFGVPPWTAAATQDVGPPRGPQPASSARSSGAPGGRGHRIPQRQVRPAETRKDLGTPASPSTGSPPPASVPPPQRPPPQRPSPHRRPKSLRPTTPK